MNRGNNKQNNKAVIAVSFDPEKYLIPGRFCLLGLGWLDKPKIGGQSELSLQCFSVSFFILINLLKSHEPHEFSPTQNGKRVNETTSSFEVCEGDNILGELDKLI